MREGQVQDATATSRNSEFWEARGRTRIALKASPLRVGDKDRYQTHCVFRSFSCFVAVCIREVAWNCRGRGSIVQRAELWGAVLALQALVLVYIGVDNANVVRHLGMLIDERVGKVLSQLLPDGDLPGFIRGIFADPLSGHR